MQLRVFRGWAMMAAEFERQLLLRQLISETRDKSLVFWCEVVQLKIKFGRGGPCIAILGDICFY